MFALVKISGNLLKRTTSGSENRQINQECLFGSLELLDHTSDVQSWTQRGFVGSPTLNVFLHGFLWLNAISKYFNLRYFS